MTCAVRVHAGAEAQDPERDQRERLASPASRFRSRGDENAGRHVGKTRPLGGQPIPRRRCSPTLGLFIMFGICLVRPRPPPREGGYPRRCRRVVREGDAVAQLQPEYRGRLTIGSRPCENHSAPGVCQDHTQSDAPLFNFHKNSSLSHGLNFPRLAQN
jgi:hypothetical protein